MRFLRKNRRDGLSVPAGVFRMGWLLALVVMACEHPGARVVGVEVLEPEDLNRQLSGTNVPQILDVSPHEDFVQGHIPGALWADLDRLDETIESLGLEPLRPLVMVCRSGKNSVRAAAVARGHGFQKVYSLAEGKLGWKSRGLPLRAGEVVPGAVADSQALLTRYTVVEQLAATISGLVFKPTYMLLSLALVLLLAHSRARDMIRIRWGLVSFFLGEVFCAVNFILSGGSNYVLDMLHGLGMVGMGFLVPWGLLTMLDERFLGLTAPRTGCSFRRFCGHCWKQEDVSCVLQRVLLFVALASALVSVMPLNAPLRSQHLVATVFGTPVTYSYHIPLQLADFRAYPVLAALCFLLASALLCAGAPALQRAQLWLFAGSGLMVYSLSRFLLLEAYRLKPVWSYFWEEITELLFVLGLGLFLFFYRKRLGLVGTNAAASGKDPTASDKGPEA